jgi:hypothetical protein
VDLEWATHDHEEGSWDLDAFPKPRLGLKTVADRPAEYTVSDVDSVDPESSASLLDRDSPSDEPETHHVQGVGRQSVVYAHDRQ